MKKRGFASGWKCAFCGKKVTDPVDVCVPVKDTPK